MASINEIVNAASYTGNANLGNAGFGVLQLDNKPVQQLAQYTFLYNKDEYEQRQKNADEAVAELAKLTAYNLNNAIGKDKEEGIAVMADIEKIGADYAALPLPKNPAEKVRNKIDYQNKIQKSLDKINLLNARGIAYMNHKNEILKDITLSAPEKENQINELDRILATTDTPLPAMPAFKAAVPTYSKPKERVFDTLITTPNGTIKQTISLPDLPSMKNEALLESAQFNIPPLAPNASELEVQEYNSKVAQLAKTPIGAWVKAAQIYNTALSDPKYSKIEVAPITGIESSVKEIDVDKVKKDNPIIGGVIGIAERHNAYVKNLKENGGVFIDKLGNKVVLSAGINLDQIEEINVNDGLSVDEIIYLGKFSDAAPDKKILDFDYTGAADKLRIQREQEAGANYRAKLREDGDNFRFTFGKSGKDDPAVLDEAVVYTNTLFDRIAQATDANGNVDLAKAKLTPKDFQMMGKGVLDAAGKFNITEEVPQGSTFKFDKATNTITVQPPVIKATTDKETDVTPPPININYQQVGNNKYDFNKSTTAGTEDKTRIQLTKGYNANAAEGQAKPEIVKQNGVTFKLNKSTGQYEPIK